MAMGLALPIGVNNTGRTALVSGESNDRKTILTAINDCENENAFQQDLGIGKEVIFSNNTEELRTTLLVKVKNIFLEFQRENRYKLVPNSIKWDSLENTGELILEFKYFNIETDEEQTFREIIRST